MARVFITGSSDGLGLLAGQMLISEGHQVVLHARSEAKAQVLRTRVPGAEAVLVADLEGLEGIRSLAAAANARGRFDAVIHNAGVMGQGTDRIGPDGVPVLFAVNVLAPLVLTAQMTRPDRLIYLGSGMHRGGQVARPRELWQGGRWQGRISYSQTKFMDVALAMAVARRWPDVRANAVDPGWVPTRMGGAGAPDDLTEGVITQCQLATGQGDLGKVTGQYLHHARVTAPDPATRDQAWQDDFLALCGAITGVRLA